MPPDPKSPEKLPSVPSFPILRSFSDGIRKRAQSFGHIVANRVRSLNCFRGHGHAAAGQEKDSKEQIPQEKLAKATESLDIHSDDCFTQFTPTTDSGKPIVYENADEPGIDPDAYDDTEGPEYVTRRFRKAGAAAGTASAPAQTPSTTTPPPSPSSPQAPQAQHSQQWVTAKLKSIFTDAKKPRK
jgi:hypothetical protein